MTFSKNILSYSAFPNPLVLDLFAIMWAVFFGYSYCIINAMLWSFLMFKVAIFNEQKLTEHVQKSLFEHSVFGQPLNIALLVAFELPATSCFHLPMCCHVSVLVYRPVLGLPSYSFVIASHWESLSHS